MRDIDFVDIVDALRGVVTFQGGNLGLSIAFYFFCIIFLCSVLIYIIRSTRSKKKHCDGDSAFQRRLEKVLQKDECEWREEEQKRYVKGIKAGITKESRVQHEVLNSAEAEFSGDSYKDEIPEDGADGAEDSSELNVEYENNEIKSLDFSKNASANLYPYRVFIDGAEIKVDSEPILIKKGSVLLFDTGVWFRIPKGIVADLICNQQLKGVSFNFDSVHLSGSTGYIFVQGYATEECSITFSDVIATIKF